MRPAPTRRSCSRFINGRGFLSNPYQEGGGRNETPTAASSLGAAGGRPIGAPTVSQVGTPARLFNGLRPGFEPKLQKAKYEKLYIRVSAWRYPTDPKAKTKQLWNTTMVVDDPDYRDINALAAKMLEAGAPFFDHEVKEEADVYKPLPEGHVKVGAPEIVEPTPAKR